MQAVERELLAGVLEAPDDDLPRLVYADWLEERGDPRAELIRVQCELERTDERAPGRAELEYREQRLLNDHGAKWLKSQGMVGLRAEFARGFVERITVKAADFLKDGKALFARTPLRGVKLMHPHAVFDDLVKSPLLGKLRSLSLRDGKVGLKRLGVLLGSRQLRSLRELDVGYSGLADSSLRLLADSDALGELDSLGIASCGATPESVAALFEAPFTRHLNRLDLGNSELTAELAAALARAPHLRGLRHLVLDHLKGEEGEEGSEERWGPLLDAPWLTGLRELSVREEWGVARVFSLLQQLGPCPELRRLDIKRAQLGNEQSLRLGRLPCLRGVVSLGLEGNWIEQAGLESLLSGGPVPHLRRLNLGANRLQLPAVRALSKWEGTPRLNELNLAGNEIGNEGLGLLAKAESFRNLHALDVSGTCSDDAGMALLIKSQTLDKLTSLHVSTKVQSSIGGLKHPTKASEPGLRKRFGAKVCHFVW